MKAAPATVAHDGEVEVGERVTILDLVTATVWDYRLVGLPPAATEGKELSVDSPLGTALLGRHVGDVLALDTVTGVVRFEVVEIDG